MQVLFIHGMGAHTAVWLEFVAQVRQSGVATSSFPYATAVQNFSQISSRLSSRIVRLCCVAEDS
jgi:hypothetical protein